MMSDFNKDAYLNDLPDASDFAAAASGGASGAAASHGGMNERDASGAQSNASDGTAAAANGVVDGDVDSARVEAAQAAASAKAANEAAAAAKNAATSAAEGAAEDAAAQGASSAADDDSAETSSAHGAADTDGKSDDLTLLGKAKQEAAEYLEALQRERAEFINYRNRAVKEQQRSREHGITDVLTALLPALDDIDRVREHEGLDGSLQAIATKVDKAFARFGVEKFGEKGEDFDPTKHDAILSKPDPTVASERVDTVVEAGYRLGDRVLRAARVVVATPQQ